MEMPGKSFAEGRPVLKKGLFQRKSELSATPAGGENEDRTLERREGSPNLGKKALEVFALQKILFVKSRGRKRR